jgi:hypothetical protein
VGLKFENNKTASQNIIILHDDNEDNLVNLPSEILIKNFSTILNITNVVYSNKRVSCAILKN